MNKQTRILLLWVVTLIGIGFVIGTLTKAQIPIWYESLNRSPLTPPNAVFPLVWTLLYGMIGACGALIWRARTAPRINQIKILYLIQLLLNWSWTPLFFHYHRTGVALGVLLMLDVVVGILIWRTYRHIPTTARLLIPYALWIFFATYLNFYVWQYN